MIQIHVCVCVCVCVCVRPLHSDDNPPGNNYYQYCYSRNDYKMTAVIVIVLERPTKINRKRDCTYIFAYTYMSLIFRIKLTCFDGILCVLALSPQRIQPTSSPPTAHSHKCLGACCQWPQSSKFAGCNHLHTAYVLAAIQYWHREWYDRND
jgi:hypothetical protein